MKAPIVIKKGNPVPDGYESLYIGRGSKWGNPHAMDKKKDDRVERIRVIQAYRDDLDKGGKLEHLNGFLKDLEGKALVCHCAPKKCHGDVLVQAFNERFKTAYTPILWADRVRQANDLGRPTRIFDELCLTDEGTIFYAGAGVGKSVVDETVMLMACTKYRLDDIPCDLDEPLCGFKLDLEQTNHSQQRWSNALKALEESGVLHFPIRARGERVSRDRILSTIREQASDGRNIVNIDSLQRLTTEDLTSKAAAKDVALFLEKCQEYIPTMIIDGHTVKIGGNRKSEGIAPLADSHIIGDYHQGGMVLIERAYRDPNVLLFKQWKWKLGEPEYATDDKVLALQKVGFDDTDSIYPYRVVLPHRSADYWNEKPNDDEQLWQEIAGMSKGEAAAYIKEARGYKGNHGYTVLNNLLAEYGEH